MKLTLEATEIIAPIGAVTQGRVWNGETGAGVKVRAISTLFPIGWDRARLTLTPTEYFSAYRGVPARIWEGRTETGAHVTIHIALIAARSEGDCDELARELLEMPAAKVAPALVETVAF